MTSQQPLAAASDPGWPRLVDAVQRAFAGGPYRVHAAPDRIVVHADLADARFLTVAAARRVQQTYRTELTPAGPGRVAWNDVEEHVEWTAGVDGRLVPRLTGQVTRRSGIVVTRSFEMELGGDRDGPGAPVDYAFDSSEIHGPLRAAIDEAGFRRTMSGAGKVGLWVGIGVGGAALLAGLVVVGVLVVLPALG